MSFCGGGIAGPGGRNGFGIAGAGCAAAVRAPTLKVKTSNAKIAAVFTATPAF